MDDEYRRLLERAIRTDNNAKGLEDLVRVVISKEGRAFIKSFLTEDETS